MGNVTEACELRVKAQVLGDSLSEIVPARIHDFLPANLGADSVIQIQPENHGSLGAVITQENHAKPYKAN